MPNAREVAGVCDNEVLDRSQTFARRLEFREGFDPLSPIPTSPYVGSDRMFGADIYYAMDKENPAFIDSLKLPQGIATASSAATPRGC